MTPTADLFLHHQQQSCVIEELHDDECDAPSTSSPTTEVAEPPAAQAAQAAAADSAPTDADVEQPTSSSSDTNAAASSAAEVPEHTQPVDPDVQLLLEECERLKQEGNAAYARAEYDEALQLYWQAIDQAPEDAQQRAVYLCNAAACYIKKEMWQLAAEQCTQALKIDDAYLKALMRRSQALEQLDDLEHALADAQQVLQLAPGNAWAEQVIQRLQPEVQQRQEKLKEEMLGKLKDLGNNLLGKFGLSLDNFQTEQDPATGGYSIKFVQQ